jgi:putative transposase
MDVSVALAGEWKTGRPLGFEACEPLLARGRYHHRSLPSPREVRRALAYVLLNARRHLAKSRGVSRSAPAHLDGASSARWFDGWRPEVASRIQVSSGVSEVARPRTWLLRVGWRRHGLVDPSEVPGETV